MSEAVVAVALALFLGALVRSFFGFGDAAVAMPLLALLGVGVDTAVPLVGLAGMVVALAAVTTTFRELDRRALLWLTAATLAGIPFGLLLVTRAPESVVTISLGALLVVHGAYSLLGPVLPRLRAHGWALPFGFAAGSLGSAYNFNGVPVAIYGGMRRWPARRFRSTLQAHFLVSSALVVAGQGLGGLWNREVLTLFAWALPGLVVAVPLGNALHRRVPNASFDRYVHVAITVLGALLLASRLAPQL